MEKNKELNKKINMYYRQLGKEIYDKSKDFNFMNEEILILISKIQKSIDKIQKSSFKYNKDENETIIKKILKPEKNENGFTTYLFCENCNVGNNPKSTHCINCGLKL